MSKVMVNIVAPDGHLSLADVKRRFSLNVGDIDEDFGIVQTDPGTDAYTVLVEAETADKMRGDKKYRVSGAYSNPKIEPFVL